MCRWTPPDVFKGFGRILHGGIQSGLFDEIMGWTAMHLSEKFGVTANLQVRFLKPVLVEQEIEVRCRIDSRDGERINLSAEIKNPQGVVCTTAQGTYMLLDGDRFNELVSE